MDFRSLEVLESGISLPVLGSGAIGRTGEDA